MNIGTIVIGSSQARYRVEQRLGEGVTSEVYRAVEVASGASVALKMLRPGVGEIIEANFWQEGQILGELANAARAVGDERADVPLVLDTQRVGEVRFLAMELVTGVPLDKVLEEKEWLAEGEALFVAQKVLRVLVLLHERVRRTYTDFQLQNIWLQRDENGVLTGIKVMDWNHVSERVPDAQPLPAGFGGADLARFGGYFYRMLTGKGADERGETEEALTRRAGERWDELSLGSRQLVLRALHPHTARRFGSSSAFREAVLTQQGLWASDGFDLLFDVRMWLKDNASEKENAEKILQDSALKEEESELILAKLDMAARLGAPARHVAHYRGQLKAHVGEVSRTWKTGEQYYKVGQYRSAAEKWRAEAEAKGRLDLWRWVMVAEAGAQLGRHAFAAVREKAQAVVEALDAGEVKQAFDRFSQLEKAKGGLDGLEALKQEALIRKNIDEAFRLEKSEQLDEWEKALKRYEAGQKALQRLPEQIRALIYDAQPEWPNLSERIESLTEQIRQRSESNQAVQEVKKLLLAEEFEAGRKKLEQHLRDEPSHRPLVRLCLTEADERLEAGKVEEAQAMLRTGVLYAQVPEYKSKLRDNWLNVREIARKLQPVRVEYEKVRTTLEEKHTEEMEGLKGQHTQEIEELTGQHAQKIEGLTEQHSQEIEELTEQHTQKLTNLETQYNQEVASKKSEHEQQLTTLQSKHDELIAAKEKEHQAKIAQLEAEEENARQALQASQAAQEKEEQKVKAEKERLIQELFRLQHKHQHDLENEQKRHEQKLAEIRVKYEAEIKNERAKPQKALTLVWEEEKEKFIKDLKKLFYEKRWGDFLQLAASAPQLLRTERALRFSSSSVHRDFKSAIEKRQVLIADKLLQVLELLESGSSTIARYKRQYQDMVRKVERESPESVDRLTVQGLIEYQLASKPIAAYDEIVEAIEKLLPLTGSDFAELREWLEEKREEAEGKWLEEVPQEGSAPSETTEENSSSSDDFSRSEAAPSETTEVVTTEFSKGENVTSGDDESGKAASETTEVVTTESSKGENVTGGDDESGKAASETTEVVTTDFAEQDVKKTVTRAPITGPLNIGDDESGSGEENSSSSDDFSRSEPTVSSLPTDGEQKPAVDVQDGGKSVEKGAATPSPLAGGDSVELLIPAPVRSATPEELIKKGMDALRQLTPESLEEAKRCFKEAKKLLGRAENRPLRRRIDAGQRFIQHLVEPKEAYHILTLIFPPELKEYTRISFHNRKWLESHSLMQWIEEMNRYSEEANAAVSYGQIVSAEEYEKKRSLLHKMINKVIEIWWDRIIKPVF